MSEDKVYKDSDIVWAKLSNSWWPGEVIDTNRQPEGLLLNLKKKPYCVVKFFHEDAYEYVKSSKQIFPFQCQKKEEFIKKGLALFNAKNKFMEKFPADVQEAERLTQVAELVIKTEADSMAKSIISDKLVRPINARLRRHSITYMNIIASPTSTMSSLAHNNKQFNETKNIIDKTLVSTPTSTTGHLNTTAGYNSNSYKCNLCNFTSKRQNVMIFHRKMHNNLKVSDQAVKTTITDKEIKINNNEVKTTTVAVTTPTTTTTNVVSATTEKTTTCETTKSNQVPEVNKLDKTPLQVDKISKTKTTSSADKRKTRSGAKRRSLTETITNEDNYLSADDISSVRTDETELSIAKSAKKYKNRKSSKVVHTTTTTTPVTKGYSEELRKRLLEDWSDEDNAESEVAKALAKADNNVIQSAKDKQIKGKASVSVTASVVDDDIPNANDLKMASIAQSTSNDDNTDSSSKISNSNSNSTSTSNSSKQNKLLTRIRNIPKKDRRDVILTEFNSETGAKVVEEMPDSGSSNSPKTVAIMAAVESSAVNNANVNNCNVKEPTKISCFDFRDDDDEEVTKQATTLKSKGNFKKKLLTKTGGDGITSTTHKEAEKDVQLSTEIENLLKQTSATVSEARALEHTTVIGGIVNKDELNAVAVKGLPIKERGKRIFKSRNNTRNSLVQMEDKQTVVNKGKIVEDCKSNLNGQDGNNESETSAMNEEEDKITTNQLVTNNEISLNLDKEEQESVREDESSTISEADAEFGSPTSMLDDDRLPEIDTKVNVVQKVATESDKLDNEEREEDEEEDEEDDEEEIESPPHEELSGNELEAENQYVRKQSAIKSPKQLVARTPTPKKLLKVKQSTTHNKEQEKQAQIENKELKVKRQTQEQKQKQKQQQENDINLAKRAKGRSKTPMPTEHTEKDVQIMAQTKVVSNEINSATVQLTTQNRKRRGHMKITPCRQISEKPGSKETAKENVLLSDKLVEEESIQSKKHKSSNDSNNCSVKEFEVLLERTKMPMNKKETISENNSNNLLVIVEESTAGDTQEKETKAKTSDVEVRKRCEIILRKSKMPATQTDLDNDKVQKSVQNLKHNMENSALNANSFKLNDIVQEDDVTKPIIKGSAVVTTTTNSIKTKLSTVSNIDTKEIDHDEKEKTKESLDMEIEEKPKEVEIEKEVEHTEQANKTKNKDIVMKDQTKQAQNFHNTNNKNTTNKMLGMKRKHGETFKTVPNKLSKTNGNNDNCTILQNNNNNRTNETSVKHKNEQTNCNKTKIKTTLSTTKITTSTVTTTTGGDRKHAGHGGIASTQTSKLIGNDQQNDDLMGNSEEKGVAGRSLLVNNRKICRSPSTDIIEGNEVDVQLLEEEKDDGKEDASLAMPTLTTFNIEDAQVLEMQTEEIQEEASSKILAVPTQPIPGYNETFLLCTSVNNQYKPINNVLLYLDHDLNQLVPVPSKVLEGHPNLVVNPPTIEDNTTNIQQQVQQQHIKTVLPEIASATTIAAEEEAQMLCIPAEVTDLMAEAAAATVSTVMTPALVRGNESNLQYTTTLQSPVQSVENPGETVLLLPDEELGNSAVATAGGLVADNAIIVNVDGQQIILDAATFSQLLANPDGNTSLVTDDGTEFVMTREVLAALEAQQDTQRRALTSPNSQDILAVALAGSDLYASEMLEIDTSQALQLVCSDGTLNFQTGMHLTPPITAMTSETNALLNQTPIMSTLEVPTSTSLVAVSAATAEKLKSHDMSPSSAADLLVAESAADIAAPNLEDSLAVIGLTTQSSTIPTSLELPITITNPAIAPKVSLPSVLQVPDPLMQFSVEPNVGVIAESAYLNNDADS